MTMTSWMRPEAIVSNNNNNKYSKTVVYTKYVRDKPFM